MLGSVQHGHLHVVSLEEELNAVSAEDSASKDGSPPVRGFDNAALLIRVD